MIIYLDELKVARSSPLTRINTSSTVIHASSVPAPSSSNIRMTNVTLDKTLIEILDSIILMYNTSVHRQLSKVGFNISVD